MPTQHVSLPSEQPLHEPNDPCTVHLHGHAPWHGSNQQAERPAHRPPLLPPHPRLIRLIGLVEEEVRRELLILVARKVRLDDEVALEAETT